MISKKNANDTNIVAISTEENRNNLIFCLPPKIRKNVKSVPIVDFATKLYEDENHIWRIQKK